MSGVLHRTLGKENPRARVGLLRGMISISIPTPAINPQIAVRIIYILTFCCVVAFMPLYIFHAKCTHCKAEIMKQMKVD